MNLDDDIIGCCGQPLPKQLPRQDRPRQLLFVVAAVLINETEKTVLACQRPAGKPLEGYWEFPGGKIDLEQGEMPEYALVRELYEELGILTSPDCLQPITFASHDYGQRHILMPVYAIRKWRGTPQSKEGQALLWLKKHDLPKQNWLPADMPLIPYVQDLI